MVEMRVRQEPVGRSHEVPGLSAEVKTELQFLYPPITLHRGSRPSFNGQSTVSERVVRGVIDWPIDTHVSTPTVGKNLSVGVLIKVVRKRHPKNRFVLLIRHVRVWFGFVLCR